mmetsp:Transcript_41345/g.53358  ORF Transcript_41345/g.53358 Transcript_41345/m.53358 type:complete len:403 (-) Transcript_41345:38-1246(-)
MSNKVEKYQKKLKIAESEGDVASIEKYKRKLAEKTSDVDETSLISALVASAQKRKKTKIEKEKEPKKSAKEDKVEIIVEENVTKVYPKAEEETGNVTILLFYGYVRPSWSKKEHEEAINWAYKTLKDNGCTGRLRVAREGFNSTLSGPHEGIRAFTQALREWQPEHFGNTDFKYVDNLPENQMLKGLKVWPVQELVTYGFPSEYSASIENGGNHLTPKEFHEAQTDPNAIMIDVRNYNESLIGKFQPPGTEVLDPEMRKSTEFPQWIDNNMSKLEGKKILMYCTGGIRCERASSYLVEKGLTDINQLEGGIHRYLEAYKEDGGHWVGKNYTFDRRFCHGADNAEVISSCVVCEEPWERYQAQMKCVKCKMEVLVCKTCQRNKKEKPINKAKLFCPLCAPTKK